MKNSLKIIILLLLFSVLKTKAETNIMFDNANQLYHNKMYDSASKLYMQMIDDGFCNAELFYNAGNSFYRNNKIGMAVWSFSKAYQLDKSKNVRDNLALAKNKIKDPFPTQKEIFFLRWWKGIYNLFEVNTWAILALLFFLIPMCLIFTQKIKTNFYISKKIIISFFVVSIFCLFFLAVKKYNDEFHYKGILINDTVFRKTIFEKNSQLLSEGLEVEFAGIGKNGINIILPNGEKGIIDGTNFKKL